MAVSILAALLLLFVSVPYLIPLSEAGPVSVPYENSHILSVEGSSVHFRTWLPESGTMKGKLLFVHGLGGSTFSFEKNAPALAEAGYAVLAADLPGFGYSSRRTDENHAQAHRAALLWQVLDAADRMPGLQAGEMQPWHLAGHSMGGGSVAAMALARPDRTASLILIDGALFDAGRRNRLLTLPVFSRWLQVLLEHVLIQPRRIESFLTSAYGRPPEASDVTGYLTPLSLPGTARSALSMLRTTQSLSEDELAGITSPVLALWGENDTWVPLAEADRIRRLLPQTALQVIPSAGHCPMETHADAFNKQLLSWLGDPAKVGIQAQDAGKETQ